MLTILFRPVSDYVAYLLNEALAVYGLDRNVSVYVVSYKIYVFDARALYISKINLFEDQYKETEFEVKQSKRILIM